MRKTPRRGEDDSCTVLFSLKWGCDETMIYYFSFCIYNPLISSIKGTNEALMLSITRGFYAASERHTTWQKNPLSAVWFQSKLFQISLLTFLVQIASCLKKKQTKKTYSITCGLPSSVASGARAPPSPLTQTDAVGYRVDDRCLKHTLLVKLQPNSSRQLLSRFVCVRRGPRVCERRSLFPLC